MKPPRLSVVIVLLALAIALAFGGATSALAQNPRPGAPSAPGVVTGGGGPGPMVPFFTYQGQLKQNGAAYTGACDFAFALYDQSTAGNMLGVYDYEYAVPVTNGLFSTPVNGGEAFNPSNDSAFNDNLRWLDVWVKCPAGTAASYTELLPRQLITATPYALDLVPGSQGSRVNGSAYQLLKVVNSTTETTTANPAAVTGEISSQDGVGVYGGNTSTATGSVGIGVWGRSYALGGIGVKGTGYNGSVAVYAVGNGNGIYSPALLAENTSTHTPEPAGIAIYGLSHSADTTLLVHNTGTGDLIRGMNQTGSSIIYSVSGTGHVSSTLMTTTGGSDLAEQFPVNGTPEPGTLMVIDAANPGKLIPSSIAYDPKVAGVVSGAGGLQAGMTLAEQDGLPIALAGRVYVKAEANSAPIQPGDLLTSSALPGYAMKAADHNLAQGAVIGKAMTGLDSGTGLVLVLVCLQ